MQCVMFFVRNMDCFEIYLMVDTRTVELMYPAHKHTLIKDVLFTCVCVCLITYLRDKNE